MMPNAAYAIAIPRAALNYADDYSIHIRKSVEISRIRVRKSVKSGTPKLRKSVETAIIELRKSVS